MTDQPKPPCPTCSPPVRETVGMVCPTCGTDYGPPLPYIAQIARQIGEHVPDCPDDLLWFYALLALTTGTGTTREHVHDAWAAWRIQTKPDHDALVPYDDLDPATQMLDEPYAAAIRAVAAELGVVESGHAPLREEEAKRRGWAEGARFAYGYTSGMTPDQIDTGGPLPDWIADRNPYGPEFPGTTPDDDTAEAT